MNDTEFNKAILEAQNKNPFWFDGMEENEKVSIDEIENIESSKNITYPDQYKKFISKYGAGEFAFTNVYSPKVHGQWSSWEEKDKYRLPELFIPISDNGCGDYLGFLVTEGECGEALFWADHEQGYKISAEAEYESFYTFVTKQGLNT